MSEPRRDCCDSGLGELHARNCADIGAAYLTLQERHIALADELGQERESRQRQTERDRLAMNVALRRARADAAAQTAAAVEDAVNETLAAHQSDLLANARVAAKAQAQTAAAVEALGKYGWHITEFNDKGEGTWICPAARPLDSDPADTNYGGHGPCDPDRCGYDRALNDLSAAAAAHDKAVAEKAVQPYKTALERAAQNNHDEGYHGGNGRGPDSFRDCSDDECRAALRALTTQEAESTGEGPAREHRLGVCGARDNPAGPYAACCHLPVGHLGMHQSSNGVGSTSWPRATPTTGETDQ